MQTTDHSPDHLDEWGVRRGRLIPEYWERIGAVGACFYCSVDEGPWAVWLSEDHTKASNEATEKELNAMTVQISQGAIEPRLVKLSDEELDALSGSDIRTCLKGRYSSTIKRARDGRHKSRIVAQDLQR